MQIASGSSHERKHCTDMYRMSGRMDRFKSEQEVASSGLWDALDAGVGEGEGQNNFQISVEFRESRKYSDGTGEESCGNAEMCSAHSVFEMVVENPSGDVSQEIKEMCLEAGSCLGW